MVTGPARRYDVTISRLMPIYNGNGARQEAEETLFVRRWGEKKMRWLSSIKLHLVDELLLSWKKDVILDVEGWLDSTTFGELRHRCIQWTCLRLWSKELHIFFFTCLSLIFLQLLFVSTMQCMHFGEFHSTLLLLYFSVTWMVKYSTEWRPPICGCKS